MPKTAQQVSGKRYVFEPNIANLESLGMAFSDPAKAILHVKYFGSEEITSTIGLDGISRPSAEGDLRRGYWADPQTFVLELLDIGEQKIHLTFEGDRMVFEEKELGLRLEGREQ